MAKTKNKNMKNFLLIWTIFGLLIVGAGTVMYINNSYYHVTPVSWKKEKSAGMYLFRPGDTVIIENDTFYIMHGFEDNQPWKGFCNRFTWKDPLVNVDSVAEVYFNTDSSSWLDKANQKVRPLTVTSVSDSTASLMPYNKATGDVGYMYINKDWVKDVEMYLPHHPPKNPGVGAMYARIDTAYYFYTGTKWKRIFNFEE